MSKKKTHEEYVVELAIKNPNIEVVDEYINAKTKITHHCLVDNFEWKVTPNNILSGKGCPKCAGNIKKSNIEYIKEVKMTNPNIEVLGEYIDAKTCILHKCKIHSIKWMTTPNNILRGAGCYKCLKEKICEKNGKTHNEYVNELKKINPSIEVVEEYKNSYTPILHKCLIDGYKWDAQPNNILSGKGCPKCAGNVKRTHIEYIKEVSSINPNIEVLSKYVNAKTPILHRCKIHNIEWNTEPSNVLQGCGCIECGKEKTGNKQRKSHEQYVKEVKKINQYIDVIGTYVDTKTPILHRCLIDNHEWYTNPGNILYSYCGCPQCNESSGERQVRQWLEKHNINYVFQQQFENCRDINPLPFDFYLPDYNTIIEYDHKQHFEPIEHFGGQEKFELTVKHDNIKNEYCKNNGISLLRIPYYKNVEEELNNFLFI